MGRKLIYKTKEERQARRRLYDSRARAKYRKAGRCENCGRGVCQKQYLDALGVLVFSRCLSQCWDCYKRQVKRWGGRYAK